MCEVTKTAMSKGIAFMVICSYGKFPSSGGQCFITGPFSSIFYGSASKCSHISGDLFRDSGRL